MNNERPYQVRIFLTKEFAEAARRHETLDGMQPLMDILAKHDAALDHCQFDEFDGFVKWAEVNLEKTQFPSEDAKQQARNLLTLTKNSLANEEKKGFFMREFTLSVQGQQMLNGSQGDALIADLKTLGDGQVITAGRAFVPGKEYDVPPVRKSYLPARHPGT